MTLLLGWTLVHFVWQGLAVAALLASLNLVVGHAAPLVRYRLASATLVAMLLLPVGTFEVLKASLEPAAADSSPRAERARPGERIAARGTLSSVSETTVPESTADGWKRRLEPVMPGLVGLWAAGVVLLSLRSFGGFALVQRLRRSSLTTPPPWVEAALGRLVERLRVSAPVRIYESALVRVPTVVGWFRPVILLPASALTGLSLPQLEVVLAHELAHVLRLDYLVNLLQTVAETLLFYHPAVWWVSRRMRVEREHCCDDLAVAACGNPVRYARTLAHLGELCADASAFAMAASGGSLLDRIARLVAGPPPLSRTSRSLGVLLTAGSLGLAFGVGSQLVARPAPVVAAMAQEPAKPGAAPPAKPATRPQAKPAGEPQARALPLDKVLELARAGVTPEYVDDMDALGYASLTADQLIALRHQGVSPEYVRDLATEGYRSLTVDDLLSLRSQGVTAPYAHELKEQGLSDLSISNLVELRAQGVTPKYVAELKAAGQTDLAITSLLSLRSQGVSGAYVSELAGLGYDKLSQSRLLALRAQGVTPEYVRSLAELGYRGIDTKVLLALRAQGVTPEYVRELKEAGYAGLPVGSLIELRATGVTPEFVRELKAAGYEKLSPEELVRLRSSGWSGKRLKRSERPTAGEKP